ncbi:Vegetative incompatibility protein HET-E-1 [Ceratocystis fimbriata CBS 114723]|uniref:Vegetative incompatibility protein HET-E-1 n=1 Tax=Ceratocystis fimbriata CBS 114723 TaxID=1035309 RepID=A0A2C5X1W0_9PEZI|nr:Vegetative incompatibility protein HET-E-1 [Ceratocystis fimbriata CBS 114723]
MAPKPRTEENIDALPTFLTTYRESGTFAACKVWEVARATSAATNFFDSIKIGRESIEFIDTSYGYNNPCEALMSEAKKLFSGRDMIVLSIGTGLGDVVEITDSRRSVLDALSKMAATSTRAELQLADQYGSTGVYHRFNVEKGLKDTTISDCHETSVISAHTNKYINEKTRHIDKFVTAFKAAQARVCFNEKDKEFLSDLYVTNPRTDKTKIQSIKGGLLKNCYQWIIDHKDFQQFLQEESPILWVKGDPGKGKTMLLCGIIDELEGRKLYCVSYFFCQAADGQLNTATSVLRGLIYDLVTCNPHLIKHVRRKYDCAMGKLLQNSSVWHDLCEILTNILNDESLRNVILIVDALDECRDDREHLLEFITQPSAAKWIQKVKIHLEINQDSVSAAVDSYIKLKVNELARKKKYDEETKSTVLKHFHSNANGTFLWVSLVCQELSSPKARRWHTLAKLTSFPPGLNPLYERMLEEISELEDAQVYKDIIAKSLVTYRPITLKELQVLVEGLEHFKKQKDVEEAIALCGSFLIFHDNVISFVHQSAKDYLLEKASGEFLPLGISHQHQKVFLRSLDIFQQKLKRDIYGLKDPGCLIDEVSVPEPDPLADIQYSCTFWVDHLLDSPSDDIVIRNDRVLAFFKEKYLQWLEALSFLKSIPIAGRAIQKLEFYSCKGCASFRHEEPKWIELKPKIEVNWDACLQTLEGHGGCVTSVAYSNDGQRLASGSHDKKVKIWDTTSGACLHTLKAHGDVVTSVAFSEDGNRLASGSDDKTVKIWDAASGMHVRTLESHDGWVTSVMFSNYGHKLASGSDDKTVKIWDATSGECLHTLEGHDSWVISVAFSRDGQRLASGSDDRKIKIWDANSGVCLQTLDDHDDVVASVAFTNDGQRIASGSDDKTVKIWDVTSGVCLQTLKSHDSKVTSVVFSKSGRRLASGSYDKTVKIWDVTSGAHLQTFEGHRWAVMSVVFSSDEQRLVSGSGDETVKIWDVTSSARLHSPEDHDDWVRSVVFSNDEQRLASGSNDETIKVWDATSGLCLQTLRGHNGNVTSVTFSNDGQQLASGSGDHTVKIWDPTSGMFLRTLRGHHEAVRSVTFSYDGRRLASGSNDETIKIWDVTSGECLHTLEGHDNWVRSVTFSHDGQWLASGSDDKTAKIWDATSGECLHTLEGHDRTVRPVVFSHDGLRLATGTDDKIVKIWDATSGECLKTFESHDGLVRSVASLIGGQRLAPRSSPDEASIFHSKFHSYSLSNDDAWIMKDQQRVLWLPPSFRPATSAVAYTKVALSTDSGRIIVIGFGSTRHSI